MIIYQWFSVMEVKYIMLVYICNRQEKAWQALKSEVIVA